MSAYTTLPTFELIDLIAELEFPFDRKKPLQPLKAGKTVHHLPLDKTTANWQHFFNGAQTYGNLLLRKILGKPLVISFYSAQWGEYGIDHLKQLNSLQQEIRARGGNLLIICAGTSANELETITWTHSLSLSFYFDNDNTLGKLFHVYSDINPAWNRYTGIDVNIPLLATYVLDNERQIAFDHIDTELSVPLPADELLNAIKLINDYSGRRSA